jgi:branched-chain amino acid aminotransferase
MLTSDPVAPAPALPGALPTQAVVALQQPGTPTFRLVPPHEPCITAWDRSLHFGDSLYEVARTYQGILFAFEEHLQRLHTSADLADFGPLPPDDLLHRMVHDACRRFFDQFGARDVYVRITVSRGQGDLNIDRHASGPPYALVIVKPLSSHADRPQHWAVVKRRRNLRCALDPAMKSGNYLNNVLALAEAQGLGADDALLLDYQGFVTEGTTSNFYAVHQGTVWTAPLSVGILAGVTRAWVLHLCTELGIPLIERCFTAYDLAACEELFLSSSTREVQAITTLDGKPVGEGKVGPVTLQLQAGMRRLVEQFCVKHRAGSLFP